MKTKRYNSMIHTLLMVVYINFLCIACADNIDINVEYKANPEPAPTGKVYNHPGILHTLSAIERIRQFVQNQEEPAYQAYLSLQSNPLASSSYRMQGPFTIIARDGENAATKTPSEEDHMAAYLNALMWVITQNQAHAAKSVEILNAYAGTLKEIGPDSNDDPLCASLQGFIFVNAAELIRHTYTNVSEEEVEAWEEMFKNVFIKTLRIFLSKPAYTNGNWGTAFVKAFMAFGVFLDDEALYNEAVTFFHEANDNGSLANYIDETGQCQESGRDQDHTMLGIGHLAEACEIAYSQGDNGAMYSSLDNRLMVGYEYTAQYNLGYDDVPFTKWTDVTGKYSNWEVISTEGRGQFRPVFEIAYNHYVTRKGLEMPYTKEVLERISPEVAAKWCDHPGYGTLTFRTGGDIDEIKEGYIDDNFSKGVLNWKVENGGTGSIENGVFLVKPALQSNDKYRGDITRTNDVTVLHPGNYPIMAMKFRRPPSSVLTFDSNMGFLVNDLGNQNGHNTAKIIEVEDGLVVHYWDISDGEFNYGGSKEKLPLDRATEFSLLKIKIADIVYDEADDKEYEIHWFKAFKSEAQLKQYLGQ